MFSEGRQETRDLPRPDKAHQVIKEKLVIHIDNAIKGNRHRNIRDVINEFNVSIDSATNWFHDQPTSFFVGGIRYLPKQWEAYLNAMGDFF
ncbi:hypothetical protein TNCV_4609831 [Trichonephila clavipes]|nr:hypothetical protein TNCV_4609831 [Trichonephila clavipes]